MNHDEQNDLVHVFFRNKISRSDFINRAIALGMSVAAIAGVLEAYGQTAHPVSAAALESSLDSVTRKNTVIFDMDTGPIASPSTVMNPYSEGNAMSHGLEQCCIEPLFILDYGSGKIQPWLGTSFTHNKALDVWTLKLRKGVKWSDGKDFTAADVVFTINMLKHGSNLLNMWALPIQEWVRTVEKVDDLTVRFHLTKPNPRFQLDYFSVKIVHSLWIVPEHIWKGKDPLKFNYYDPAKGWPVFTGPYKLARATPNEFIYERNPHWWGAKTRFKPLPKPERLIWSVHATEDIKVAAASNHELDSVANVSLSGFQTMKQRNRNMIAWYEKRPFSWPDPCPRFLSVNDAVAPWNDKGMRWALSYAINRHQIVAIAYQGITTPSRFLFPAYPALNHYLKPLDKKGVFKKYPSDKYDPNEAHRLLAARGYRKGTSGFYEKDGNPLTLEVLIPVDFPEFVTVGRVLLQQLQTFGINATGQNLAFGTWGQQQSTGNYQAALSFSCGSVDEPWSTLDAFNAKYVVPVGKTASNNVNRWKNTEYSRIVDKMASTPLNTPELHDLFIRAATIWLSELPVLPLTQAEELIPFDTTYWKGWPTSRDYYAAPATWSMSNHVILHRLHSTHR